MPILRSIFGNCFGKTEEKEEKHISKFQQDKMRRIRNQKNKNIQ